MVFKNAKEGTGVRARGDLSPHRFADRDPSGPWSGLDLLRVARFLNGLTVAADTKGASRLAVPTRTVARLLEYVAADLAAGRAPWAQRVQVALNQSDRARATTTALTIAQSNQFVDVLLSEAERMMTAATGGVP